MTHTNNPNLGMIDGIEHVPASDAPAIADLDRTFYRPMNPDANCPGFRLWAALADDGVWYFMDGDHAGGVETRLFFRSHGFPGVTAISNVVRIADLGENPDVAAWDRARAKR
jgi:hypothetical protein